MGKDNGESSGTEWRSPIRQLENEMNDRITEYKRHIELLREALRPFSEVAQQFNGYDGDVVVRVECTVHELRKANLMVGS